MQLRHDTSGNAERFGRTNRWSLRLQRKKHKLLDAACASSLVAVEIAMRDLMSGKTDLAALAGGYTSIHQRFSIKCFAVSARCLNNR